MDVIKKQILSGEYLAGFIDGEGYIGITFQRKKETHYQSASGRYHPYLIIANNNYEILDDIKKFTNSGRIYKLSRNFKQKQGFQYKLTEMEPLKNFLYLIKPYLRIKQKQCKLLINFIDLRKNAKIITGRGHRGVTSYTIEEEIYRKLLELNKRGE